MTRVLPRPHFHSSQLFRCLIELDLLGDTEPTGDFAEELGHWMHFTDAISLAPLLDSGMAAIPVPSPEARAATAAQLTATFDKTRSFMVGSITKSCKPGSGPTPIKLPLPLDLEVSYLPYRRFYEAHQRDMELSVEPLRVNLRAALAKASPRLRKLAELDVVMNKFLGGREAHMLARVPLLLQKRFDAHYRAHAERLTASGQPDNHTTWMQAGGWLASFCQELHRVLLAEAELRLQPCAGLLEALNQQKHHE